MHIFFLKTLDVFVVTVVALAADRKCEQQRRVIDQMSCISRRTFSLLIPVLSPACSFCAIIPVLHGCSLCNLLCAAIPLLQVAIAAGWNTLWALLMAMSTPTPQAASRLPAIHQDVAKTLIIVSLCKPVLVALSFDYYNYVQKCCEFEDF
jgi:hypothetical protein